MPEPQGGNFLTRKLGPLPIWGWLAIIAAAGLAFMYWKKIGPFGSGPAVDSGTGDANSLGSMIGAGGSPNLGVLADGGPATPTSGVFQPAPSRMSKAGELSLENYGYSRLPSLIGTPLPGASAGSR